LRLDLTQHFGESAPLRLSQFGSPRLHLAPELPSLPERLPIFGVAKNWAGQQLYREA
jgi:hypothetical protein